ncbi:Pr6Pr family membrane protein [Kribbella sp. NPDC051770]|uniref:Pr6Pr family membrane protein n=1 Tax=Kribbella sp. NPDC051770 TaxID=3155413 RepID=UPI00343A1D1D
MTKSGAGRAFHAVTAAAVIAGIVIQLVVTATSTGGFFPDNPDRVFNVFAYFTILSNLLLGGTTLLLAAGTDRDSTLFRTLRLNGVLCIAVTGIVYWVALNALADFTGGAAVANFLLHTATPLLGVLGWLLFGPRGRTSPAIVGWSIVFPLLWLGFTLIRGAAIGFWPYPFVDADDLGYGKVLLNCLLVALLFLALAFGAMLLDRRLNRTAVER